MLFKYLLGAGVGDCCCNILIAIDLRYIYIRFTSQDFHRSVSGFKLEQRFTTTIRAGSVWKKRKEASVIYQRLLQFFIEER